MDARGSCGGGTQSWLIPVSFIRLAAIDSDESTEQAIGDWHYWAARGYLL
jgi:hypothetical protein